MKKLLKNNIFERALKTFIQGFLAVWGAFFANMINNTTVDKTVLLSVFIGALASGLSAVMNYVIQLIKKDEEKWW